MGNKFNDFVQSMNEKAKEGKRTFDPTERIAKFTALVDGLYDSIKEWLSDSIKTGGITTGIVPVSVREERLGVYTANSMWIQIGAERVTLMPIGTVLIGTDARVDLQYKTKEVMIVRTGENILDAGDLIEVRIVGEPARPKSAPGKKVWKYVSGIRRMSYTTLTKDTFQVLLMNVINETH